MTELWPRISRPVARAQFESFGAVTVQDLARRSATTHPQMSFAATGGSRVTAAKVGDLAEAMRDVASAFGYPDRAGDSDRIAFDRAAAETVYPTVDITTFEAANGGMWSFLAVVAIPDVTLWRFGRSNGERWIASDLTRHMFARLWWQALTLAADPSGVSDYSLLRRLSESDLNQIMERRSLAGNPRLARALARSVINSPDARRELIRDVTPRLRRRLAFIDFSALTDDQIDSHISEILDMRGPGVQD